MSKITQRYLIHLIVHRFCLQKQANEKCLLQAENARLGRQQFQNKID